MDKNHALYDPSTKNVIGGDKMEISANKVINTFICLRSKSDAYEVGDKEVATQNGLQEHSSHLEYENNLFITITTYRTCYGIQEHSSLLEYENNLFITITTYMTCYGIESDHHELIVQSL